MTDATRRDVLWGAAALGATDLSGRAAPDAALRESIAYRVDRQRRGSGVVMGIRRPEGRSILAHGRTRLEGGAPVDGRSIFPAASLTKVFTSLLLADAARRGELSIDDPLSRHLPAGVGVPAFEGREITLADLATHGSGLPLRPPNLVSKDEEDPYAGYRTEHLYAAIADQKLSRAPGSKFEYSNYAYGLLGHAVEHRLDAGFGELLSKRITGPLGMGDTGLVPPRPDDLRRVQGYSVDSKPVPAWDLAALVEAGGLFSTVEDLLTFLGVWIGPRETSLSAAGRDMLRPSRPGASTSVHMGLGWRIERAGGRTLVWSNGSAGGVRAFMAFRPDTRTGVAGFNNAASGIGVDDIGRHILDPSEPVDRRIPVVHHEIAYDPSMDRFVGLYRYEPGDELPIRREGAGLVTQTGPHVLKVRPEGPTKFFVLELEAEIEFVLGKDGAPEALMLTQGGQTWRYPLVPNR